MPTVKVNEINIYYEIHGEGFPLIMILGLSCDVNWWTPEIIDAMALNFKTIIFDNRGVGRTDKPEINYSIKIFAEDTIGLMDALNIEKAHILGFSIGGFIAQEIALSYPDRVEKLVLCATHAAGTKHLIAHNEAMDFILNPPEDPREYVNGFIPLLFTKTFIDSNSDFIQSYKQRLLKIPFNLDLYRHQLQGSIFRVAKRHKKIITPTLILQGKHDIIIPPENAEILKKEIQDSKVIMFENAAHFLFQPDPESLVNVITEFLTEKIEIDTQ
ncbi:MAG: alpha/beta fold hydrolase [Candidatus Thorarchaeota archaeon]